MPKAIRKRSKERAFFFLFWTSSPVNRASNCHSGHSSPTKLPHRRNQPKPPLFMALEQELVVHWITPASNVTPSNVRSRHLAHRRRCTRSVCTAGDFRQRPSSSTSAVFVTDSRKNRQKDMPHWEPEVPKPQSL
ncbi:uncharacterized protein LOC115268252 [Aedes albopictus]|uniref:Secreted protein n=1 Tax=Aedes albopictus TaxID=7160 RepID=A0ABM1ZX75_AEDAL